MEENFEDGALPRAPGFFGGIAEDSKLLRTELSSYEFAKLTSSLYC